MLFFEQVFWNFTAAWLFLVELSPPSKSLCFGINLSYDFSLKKKANIQVQWFVKALCTRVNFEQFQFRNLHIMRTNFQSFISLIVLHCLFSVSCCLKRRIFTTPKKNQQLHLLSWNSSDVTDQHILLSNLNFFIKWRCVSFLYCWPTTFAY